MVERVTMSAPAKVNLRLKVLARESSGYHGLETIFQAIDLCDELEVSRGGEGVALEVEAEGMIETGPATENLAYRAAQVWREAAGVEAGVRIRLRKRIPAAAGMGGGSSDAAAALLALNTLHGDPLSRDRLLQLAIGLGSDVPFFLCGSPYALAWSRGERMLALPPLPARPVLVAHPGESMPTGAAFHRIAEARGDFAPYSIALDLERLRAWESVATIAINDFEEPAYERIPRLAGATLAMRTAGARIALLAGSGASVFAVLEDGAEIDRLEQDLGTLGFATWRARTLERMPLPTPSAG